MSNETISWNSSDFETEEEKNAAMQIFKKQMDEFFNEAFCSYEDYKKERDELVSAIHKEFLNNTKENGFFIVRNRFSEYIVVDDDLLYMHPFDKIDKAFEYIKRVQDGIPPKQKELMWWDISWHEIVGEEYKWIYTVYVNSNTEINYLFTNSDLHDKLNAKQHQVILWFNTMRSGESITKKRVNMPYSAGDIIKVDKKPFEPNCEYAVYTGYENTGITDGRHDELTGLYYFSFFCWTHQFERLLLRPEAIQVVDSCDSPLIMKLSEFFKKNPDYYGNLKAEHTSNYWDFTKKINDLGRMVLTDDEKISLGKIDRDVTLDKYIYNVNIIKDMFMNEFSTILQFDELYHIQAVDKDGEIYSNGELFNSYTELQKYINYEKRNIMGEWPEAKWYWKIERQKKIDNQYTTIMECKVDEKSEVIDFNLGDCFSDVKENHKLYQSMKYVNLKSDSFAEFSAYDLFSDDTAESDGANIELPFQIGDIIYIDKSPVKEPFYVVYIGKRKSYDTTIHYCLRRREWGDYKLTAEHLSHPFSFEKDGNSYFPFMKKVNTSDDESLNKASYVLKKSPELVLKIDRTGVSCSDDDKLDRMLTEQYNILYTDDEYIKPTD